MSGTKGKVNFIKLIYVGFEPTIQQVLNFEGRGLTEQATQSMMSCCLGEVKV